MTPPDRQLENLQTGALCQKQELGIEAETGNRHFLEDRNGLRSFEKLKTALGIVNSQTEDGLHHEIKDNSAEFTAARLMYLDIRAINGAGTDDHIRALLLRGL